MLVAVVSFAAMDATMKLLAGRYPPLQVTCLRAWASVPFLLAPLLWSNAWAELRPRRLWLHGVRGLLGVAMLSSFVYALHALSLADAYAVYMAAPLLVTALGVPLLGDRVPPRRWFAIAVGLVGVLVLLNPTGVGFASLGGLAAVVSVVCYAVGATLIRVLGRDNGNRAMVLSFLLIVGVGSALLGARSFRPIEAGHWPWIALIGLSGALGQFCITDAFRRAPPAVVAPFEYTALVWAVGIDWVFWDVLPGARVLIGAAIVIASGLAILRDERQAALTAGTAPGSVPP